MSDEALAVKFAIGGPGRAAREILRGGPPLRVGPPDAELSAFSAAGLVVQAASCRGLAHRARGIHRQDAFALDTRSGDDGMEQVVAVACDGVGQFGRSDEAALAASRWLAVLGSRSVPWPEAFGLVSDELAKLAAEARAGSLDSTDPHAAGMATTAMAVSAWRDAENAGWAGEAAWVGDSTLWHLSLDSRWTLIAGPSGDDGARDADYHSTSVRPLPTSDGACASRDFRAGPGVLFVMTDGVANPLRWSDDVQTTLAAWWSRPPDPFTFAAQVNFARKSHLDDRTVIGIWPASGETDAGQEG
jgi:hypothetical protein